MRNLSVKIILLIILSAQFACNAAVAPTKLASLEPSQPVQTITASPTSTPTEVPTSTATPEPTAIPPLRFAVIGDYGSGSSEEYDVAQLVASYQPELIITTGDNNYPIGSAQTIDQNIGQYYHAYIYPYVGEYGVGASENNFFPSMGNHDWIPDQAQPYLDYFELPENERYYQFSRGPVAFFVLDSDAHEPDGVNSSSLQAEWLKQQMALSTATWKIVYFHNPPYSSGTHGSITWMRWPFQDWGADLVLSGHDHTYERLQVNGLTYIVNGLGGGSRYSFVDLLPESLVRYRDDHGAMIVDADNATLHFQFINHKGEIFDDFTIFPTP